MSPRSPESRLDDSVVREALRGVPDPCSIATGVPIDILDMGIVREIELHPDHVRILLRLTNPFCFQAGLICEAIQHEVGQAMDIPVTVELDPTDDWTPELMAPAAQARLRELRPLPRPVVRSEVTQA